MQICTLQHPRATRYDHPLKSNVAKYLLYAPCAMLLNIPQVYRYLSSFNSAPVLYAGTGASGYTGDGGAATLATLNVPVGIVADSNGGKVYVSEQSNNCVRVIAMGSGIISTLAGYTSFWGPGGIRLDSVNGILYVSEFFSSTGHYDSRPGRVSKVVLSTLQVSAVLGPGAAVNYNGLWALTDLDVDSGGNLFVAQGGTNCITYLQVSNSAIYTAAGSGSRDPIGYTGDGGPATSARLGIPQGIVVDQLNGRYLFIDNRCDPCGFAVVRSVQMSFPYTAYQPSIIRPSRYPLISAVLASHRYMIPVPSKNSIAHLTSPRFLYPISQPSRQPTVDPTATLHQVNNKHHLFRYL